MAEFDKTKLNKLGRLANRGSYDFATIHSLIDSCPVLHVSFNDKDADHEFPVTLPMLGCMGKFEDQEADPATTPLDVYIHGYVSGRMFRKAGDSTSSTSDASEVEGLPMTISATFLDALILSLTPFHNSCNYRSAILYGYASPVTSPEESLYAMKLITDNMLPGRWDGSRVPPTRAELKSTSILKVRVVGGSAKVRVGGPSEDRGDEKDEGLRGRCWTGSIPYWGTWGEPVEAEGNKVKEVEPYIEQWRQKETRDARNYAFEAIDMDGKAK